MKKVRDEAAELHQAYDDLLEQTRAYPSDSAGAIPRDVTRAIPSDPARAHPNGDVPDHLTSLLHDPRFAKAQHDGRSHLSVASEAGDDRPRVIRKEAAEIKLPSKLPTVPNLAEWKVTFAHALVQASAFGDRAEISWFKECSDASKDFEYFGHSGPERFSGLDNKLVVAITAMAAQNSTFKRELDRHTR